MQRHPFDPISFFFGVVLVAISAWVLFADDLDILDARWLWPLLLILGGLALLASMFGSRQRRPLEADPGGPTGHEVPDDLLQQAAAELPDEPHLS